MPERTVIQLCTSRLMARMGHSETHGNGILNCRALEGSGLVLTDPHGRHFMGFLSGHMS